MFDDSRSTKHDLKIIIALIVIVVCVIIYTFTSDYSDPDEFYKGPAPADAASSDLVDPRAE